MTLSRRTILQGSAAALATGFTLNGRAPAIAQGANRTLKFIPHANLSSIDPIGTTGYVVRNHGYMVYDTLYALDAGFKPRPQMAEGHEVSADGKTYTIRLREGLRFHDGEPVRSRDCVASLKRWAARDGLGQTLIAMTDDMPVVDDRTFQIRLKEPFPLLLDAIGKASSPVPFIMPERFALTDPATPIKEAVGSGPFRFIANEWVPGSRAAYSRFEGYVPRNEPASGAAGGKVVHFDRVEWLIIPDPATASAALQRGEVDWLEQPQNDLLPVLQGNKDITITTLDPVGTVTMLRFNHLHPPFDNPKVRQAVLAAVNQTDYMTAVVGNPSLLQECKSVFPCGTPNATGSGGEAMVANLDKAKALLKESGYKGEKVTIISPTDIANVHTLGLVTEDLLKRLGMNVELVATDWGTVLARRASQEPPEKGGWSIFHTTAVGVEFMSPASHIGLRGNGRAAWPGWPTNATLEQLRTDWLKAPNDQERLAVVAKIEREAFTAVPYVPLGQYRASTATRSNLRDLIQFSPPFAWNVRKV